MARSFNTGNYLKLTGIVAPTGSASLFAYFKTINTPTGGFTLVGFGSTSAYFGLGISRNAGNGNLTFNAFSNPSGASELDANTGPVLAAGTQYTGLAVFNGTTATCYTNGANPVSVSVAMPGVGNTVATIGALDISGAFLSIPNQLVLIAEAAVWTVALTAAEALALAAGYAPYLIRPQSLYGYWPILGVQSPEPDLSMNSRSMTLNGTPAQVMHVPVFHPIPGSEQANTFHPAWAMQSNQLIGGGTW